MKHAILIAAALCGLVLVPTARAQDLYVGSNTPSNTLDLTNGTNSFVDTYIGFQLGADSNTLNVLNPGTLLTNSGDLFVGYEGSGNSVVISNGGTVAVGSITTSAASRAPPTTACWSPAPPRP